ncbi:MAG: hypothetical protein JKY54_16895 [Flavobacteriales bacterium]|nr:hypothetical protein [Flavobacteriales bacterium]
MKPQILLYTLAFIVFIGCSGNTNFDPNEIEEALIGYGWEITSLTSVKPIDWTGDGVESQDMLSQLKECSMTYFFCTIPEIEYQVSGTDCEHGFSTLGGWHVEGDTLFVNQITKGSERGLLIKTLEENTFTATELRDFDGVLHEIKYAFKKNPDFETRYSWFEEWQK